MEKPDVKVLIERLYLQGMSNEDIASKLRVSSQAVRSWVNRNRQPSWATYFMLEKLLKKRG